MLRLIDPILNERPPPDGIELPVLHEPDSLERHPSYAPSTVATVMTSRDLADAQSGALPPVAQLGRFEEPRPRLGQPPGEPEPVEVDSRMVLNAVKHQRSFDWVGSQSALPQIVRQMQKYGWSVTVREERPAVLV